MLIVVPIVLVSQRRKLVGGSSIALGELRRLNEDYLRRLNYQAPIKYQWLDMVNSKAKLDRYDLTKFFFAQLARHESEVQHRIDLQLKSVSVFAEYQRRYEQVGNAQLGNTTSDQLNPEAFRRIERTLFAKRKLREPTCGAAHVRCSVQYTSPQGQNSYSKWHDWKSTSYGAASLRCGVFVNVSHQRSSSGSRNGIG